MEAVRWGIISTARIGLDRVVPAMLASPLVEVRAIASRSAERAKEAAATHGIALAYGSYEELLADPEIEAVYNPLPNHLHVPITVAAAKAGKHVLCEKPIAMTAGEAELLRPYEGRVLIAEAFMIRHHPQWQRMKALVEAGAFGEVRAVHVVFSYFNTDPANIRNMADIGGGGLMDIGCYAIVSGRYLFGVEPVRAVSLIERDPALRTDRLASALVDFGEGRRLLFTVSTQLVPHQRVEVLGTRGRGEILIPFNAPTEGEMRLITDDGSKRGGESARLETLPAVDQYRLQAEAFSRAVRGEVPLAHGVEDAIANMRVIDAIRRSETSGAWETIG